MINHSNKPILNNNKDESNSSSKIGVVEESKTNLVNINLKSNNNKPALSDLINQHNNKINKKRKVIFFFINFSSQLYPFSKKETIILIQFL